MYKKLAFTSFVSLLLLVGFLVSFLNIYENQICQQPTCFCDYYLNEEIGIRPFSFYSCLSFHVIALIIIFYSDDRTPTWYLALNVIYLSCIGSFSMIYHSRNSFAGEYLDGLSISLYAWFIFSVGLLWFKFILVTGSIIIFGLQFVSIATTPLFATIASIAVIKVIWTKRFKAIYPSVFFVTAVIFWALSQDSLGCIVWFGHGIWHILCSITIGILYFILNDKTETVDGLQISDDGLLLAGSTQYKQVWARDTCYSLIIVGLGCNKKLQDEDATKYARNYLNIYSGATVYEKGYCCPSMRFLGCETRIGPNRWKGWNFNSAGANLLAEIVNDIYQINPEMKFPSLLAYKKCEKHGFVIQEAFSDFQDSRDRSPSTFLTNLFYWKCLVIQRNPSHDDFKKKLVEHFFRKSKGLYTCLHKETKMSKKYYCLEDQLFAILLEFDTNIKENVKKHWNNYPKSSMIEEYDNSLVPVHWIPKAVGLEHYHDTIVWPWLDYFYHGMIKEKSTIPSGYKFKEIVKEDGYLYEPEKNFLMSYAFRDYYLFQRYYDT
jgi:hypothetical protein